MGKKFGFSWSWKRALGISTFKQRIARETGVPTTKQGLERKVGAWFIKLVLGIFMGKK